PHRRRYVSIYGPLEISRCVYGTREGQKIEHVPLDARLGLPAGEISYVLEDWLERMCVKDAYRDSVESLVELLGVRAKVSVETAEKHTREMAEHAASFRASQPVPPPQEEGELLVATADAKGVPMIRPPDAQAAPHAHHRRGKGEKANKKQMAYVGAVYSIDRFRRTADDVMDELLRKERAKDRPRPQHKRVRAEMTRPGDELLSGVLLHGPSHLFVGMAVECHERDPNRRKELVCLLDGERQLWDLQGEWLPRAIGILDILHVNERLWTAAHCFHAEKSSAADQFVERYLRMLLEGKVDSVIRSLQRLLVTRNLKGEKRKRVMATITYYQNNRQHMRYDEYLAAGYPIGSGVVEGACRHLVKDRMEGAGMRWSLVGAQAMLSIRAFYLNGDWKAFLEHRIEQEQIALYGQAA
ncbi:MAG: ISKra4 family transposase, partial [Gemmataceae bacterium]